ncbi:MAG: U32 family peptidase, partial [Traorella sp.]
NTLIHDHELEACKSYIKELAQIGIDALIVQDLGIMNILQHEFPQLHIHASTQMHIHNLEGVKQAKKWNLSRVVVARESNLELIRKMCQQGIEIETFVQGAYCVSYSGECHMSRNIGGRSANRGECAQSCRLPYTLYKNNERVATEGKYLLSLKDLNALELIPQLIENGVASFKIEGRMKRSEYVACMCHFYRQAIDAALAHKKFIVNEAILTEMKKIYNRGFTTGYLENHEGLDIMSPIRPNHQGIPIGKVIGFHHDKMILMLDHELNQHDGIRILNNQEDQGFIVNYIYKNGQLVNHADKGKIELQKVKAKVGDIVMKTSDIKQLEKLSKTITENPRKIPIEMEISFIQHQPLTLTISDHEHKITIQSDTLIEKALHSPLDENRLKQQFMKLGNTPYICTKISIHSDSQSTMPISKINEIRRKACDELTLLRIQTNHSIQEKKAYSSLPIEITYHINVNIQNEKQYEIIKEYPVEIYLENRQLYEKIKNPHVHYSYPRVCEKYDIKGRVHDIGGIKYASISSPYMNTMNIYSANVLFNEGIPCVSLSYECNDSDLKQLVMDYQQVFHQQGNFELEVYGRVENMILENCIIKSQMKTKKHCQLCHQDSYILKDMKNKSYRLIGDENCRMKVYHSDTFNRISKVNEYRKMGITNFALTFTFESENEIKEIMNSLMNQCK